MPPNIQSREDYVLGYSAETTIELQEAAGMLALTNTTYMNTSGQGHDQQTAAILFGTVGATDEAVGQANIPQVWGNPVALNATRIKIAIDRQVRSDPVEVLDYDEKGVAFDIEGKGRAKVSNALQVQVSRAIAEYMLGLDAYTTFEPAAGDLPQANGKGDNDNAGKIANRGIVGPAVDATNDVGIKGDRSEQTFGQPSAKGSKSVDDCVEEVGGALDDFFRYSALRFQHIYVANGQQIGPEVGSLWAMADPAVIDLYAKYLLDHTGTELVVDTGVFGPETPRIFSSQAYHGRRYGIDLMSLPTPALQPAQTNAASQGAGFPILCGSNMAVSAYVEPTNTSMEEATRNVGRSDAKVGASLMGQWFYWGRGLVNAPLLTRATVRSLA